MRMAASDTSASPSPAATRAASTPHTSSAICGQRSTAATQSCARPGLQKGRKTARRPCGQPGWRRPVQLELSYN